MGDSNTNQSPTGDTGLGKGKLTFLLSIHLVTSRPFGVLNQADKGRGRVNDLG